MAPVYELFFRNNNSSLCLTEDQVNIYYKIYKTKNDSDMNEIVQEQITPGENSWFFMIADLNLQ